MHDEYEGIAANYDHFYNACPVTAGEDRFITKLVASYYKPGVRVLDIGCGTGMVLEHVPFRTADYLGIDISPSMLKVARGKFPKHTFMECNGEYMRAVRSDSMDFVFFLFGVYPLMDAQRTLTQLRRVLRPGGDFLIIFYSPSFSVEKDYQEAMKSEGIEPTVFPRLYSVSMAKQELQDGGLVVSRVIAVNGHLRRFFGFLPKVLNGSFWEKMITLESKFYSKFNPDKVHYFVVTGCKYYNRHE